MSNAKVVSEMLGHASITITLNSYSHVLPDMRDSAVDAMKAALATISLSQTPFGLQHKSREAYPGSVPLSTKCCYLQEVYKWAMLDSNQRPPPCKLGQGFPTTLCPVRKFSLSERFTAF